MINAKPYIEYTQIQLSTILGRASDERSVLSAVESLVAASVGRTIVLLNEEEVPAWLYGIVIAKLATVCTEVAMEVAPKSAVAIVLTSAYHAQCMRPTHIHYLESIAIAPTLHFDDVQRPRAEISLAHAPVCTFQTLAQDVEYARKHLCVWADEVYVSGEALDVFSAVMIFHLLSQYTKHLYYVDANGKIYSMNF